MSYLHIPCLLIPFYLGFLSSSFSHYCYMCYMLIYLHGDYSYSSELPLNFHVFLAAKVSFGSRGQILIWHKSACAL